MTWNKKKVDLDLARADNYLPKLKYVYFVVTFISILYLLVLVLDLYLLSNDMLVGTITIYYG